MSLRVLLIDDSAPMRRLLGRFLEAAGAGPPMEAADGDQAIALFKPGGFDLVICDVNIPKRDGFEVMREIRGTSELVASDFSMAFAIIALIAAASSLVHRRLPADAGAELTGRRS